MKKNLTKTLSLILVAFTVFLLLAPSGLCASFMRGLPLDTGLAGEDNFSWDATGFDGFCYPVGKHLNFVNESVAWGERLWIEDTDDSNGPLGSSYPSNHVIDKEELVYMTVSYPSKQKVASKLGLNESTLPEDVGDPYFHTLAWFGVPHIAIDGDSTRLSRIVLKQGGSDRKCLKAGEAWDLGMGYTLSVKQVDVDGNKVWFSLEKDGEELESAIVNVDGTAADQIFAGRADLGDRDDQLYFITYVDSVFRGPVDSLAVFKYTWLIDKDNVLVIENGDEYQGFEVKEAIADRLVLKNKETISLEPDDDTYFTDSWYFTTSDEGKGSNGGYIVYPATAVTIEDETVSESVENDVAEVVEVTPDDADSTVDATNSKAGPAPLTEVSDPASSESDEESSEKSPGFGLLTCILGLGACFVRRK